MSVESTRDVISKYVESNHTDLSMMADNVVFTNMGTGDEHHGIDGVRGMLQYIYHTAFDAHPEPRNMVFADGKAVLEADFVGRHIGEFAGVPATNKMVRVPLCVVYDLENDKIARGRIYFEAAAFFKQVGDGQD
jgi:steroid delta-isomerase-like uncharacterized protein